MQYRHFPFLSWDSQTLENAKKLEAKFVKGPRHIPYKVALHQLGFFSLARRKVRGGLIRVFEIADGLLGFQRNADFDVRTHFGLRDHAFKIHQQCPT